MQDVEKANENNASPQTGPSPSQPSPGPKSQDDPEFLVKWDVDDKDNPQNWSLGYKSWVTVQLSMLALAASVASSLIAPANPVVAKYLGINDTVVVLDISLFV